MLIYHQMVQSLLHQMVILLDLVVIVMNLKLNGTHTGNKPSNTTCFYRNVLVKGSGILSGMVVGHLLISTKKGDVVT